MTQVSKSWSVGNKPHEIVSVLDFGPTTDIGASINLAIADGHQYLRIPAGAYTQSTQITTAAVHLYADYSGDYGYCPVVITKDGDFPHIITTAAFSSIGIEWSGAGVSGTSNGIEIRSRFNFVGQVTDQPGHGMEIVDSGSNQTNGSVFSGGCSSNGGSGVYIENTALTDSDDMDVNIMTFNNLRCSSNGLDGLTLRAGLYNKFYNCDFADNHRYGLNINAANAVQQNYMTFYTENNGPKTGRGTMTNHDGATSTTILVDSGATWLADDYIGYIITNTTKGESATITDNDATSITSGALSGSASWEAGDDYVVECETFFGQTGATNLSDNTFESFRDEIPDTIIGSGTDNKDTYIRGNIGRRASVCKGVFQNDKQPWFQVYPTADLTNVTGNGVSYDIIFAATPIKDTQSSFNTAPYTTFTAPVAGAYDLNGSVRLQGLGTTAHSRCTLNLVTTGRTYNLYDFDLDAYASASNVCCMPWAVIVDMSANDTAKLTLTVYDNGQDVDISGGSGQTYFMGRLLG